MNRRLLTITKPFEANRLSDGVVRKLKIGQTVWCDLDQLDKLVEQVRFEVANVWWFVHRSVFVTRTKQMVKGGAPRGH